MVEPFADDGHRLFSNSGISRWTPLVDSFLKKQHLDVSDELLPLPPKDQLKVPDQLTAKGQKAFQTYLQEPPHKAFAVSSEGAFGHANGCYDVPEAEEKALGYCEEYADDCEIYDAR